MSEVVKCNSCNIIIDELLSYIQNKLSVIDEDTLVRICTSTFSSEEIKKSKALLFDSVTVNKAKVNRKNKGKEQRDLVDIVNLFKSTEPDLFPIFVARDLERLPPILFDHLDCTKLLKDLLRVQNELKDLKETYVTQTQLCEFKAEVLKMQSDSLVLSSACKVNMKRGAWLMDSDSGPIGLSHVNNSTIDEYNSSNEETSINGHKNNVQLFRKIVAVDGEQIYNKTINGPQRAGVGSIAPRATATGTATSPNRLAVTSPVGVSAPLQSAVCNNSDRTIEEGTEKPRNVSLSVTEREPVLTDDGEGWQRVSHRRKPMRYRYLGTSGTSRDNEGRFKAAVKKVPIFITKVHKDTTEKDIVDYIYERMQEKITLEEILFKYDRDYKAYKMFVRENKLSLFLDNKLWPEGVIFRRFVNFKARKPNANSANNVTVSGP